MLNHLVRNRLRLLQAERTRRTVLKYLMAGLAGLAIGCSQTRQASMAQGVRASLQPTNERMPRLYCIAYIDPDIPSQANQESTIARYPLALVPQDSRRSHAQWRDRIKQLNPHILMLAYQLVIEETTVPGPGHDRLRLIKNSWCVHPDGHLPTVKPKDFRVYDPREVEWQEGFLEACRITLNSYPYAGLFLDQCTVYDIAHPKPTVRVQMRQALQATLLRLREQFPNIILIGNANENWQGLNGEMNEGRPRQMLKEIAPYCGHVLPAMDLYFTALKNPSDFERVKREMTLAHSQGAYYGAALDYQHVLWFDAFDEIMAKDK